MENAKEYFNSINMLNNINQQDYLKVICMYLPYEVEVLNVDYKNNYNGHKVSVLNGIYPLYDKERNPIWQYTTDKNSTGQSLDRCKLLLTPLSKITENLEANENSGSYLDYLIKHHPVDFFEQEEVFDCFMSWLKGEDKSYQIDFLPNGLINHLRSEGYDVDDLIRKGYAVDKTKLK